MVRRYDVKTKAQENHGLMVGPPGLEPGTYGLKGREQNTTSSEELRDGASPPVGHDPQADHSKSAELGSVVKEGVRVRIRYGLAAGIEAVVIGRWHSFGKVPAWRVRSDDLVRDRVLREDFLEVLP